MKDPDADRSLEVFSGLIQNAKTTLLKGGENPPESKANSKKAKERKKTPKH